jgi:peptide/nickel transport system ATP-binding protein
MTARRLLEVQDLGVTFRARAGLLMRKRPAVRAVDGVSFHLDVGETLSLVGESGCGKSSTARAILGLNRPTGGRVVWHAADGGTTDLVGQGEAALRGVRQQMRMVFQDPQGSLNPRLTVLDIVGEALLTAGIDRAEVQDRVAALLGRVGLRPEYIRRYPHAFSGGERQRIGIARALVTRPRLVIADEAVSALDVSVRAQTVNLLQDLQAELGLTYLFVAHDLGIVRHISTRVAVMYVGRIVELAETRALFDRPAHPYSEALLSAMPIADPRARRRGRRIRLHGEVADPANPPPGCHFHPRCRFADARCRTERPTLREARPGHHVACHHAEALCLGGIGMLAEERR